MVDESKHRYWKGWLISCPRCEHRMSVEDYRVWHNMCPFCGKIVKLPAGDIEEVDNEEDRITEQEQRYY